MRTVETTVWYLAMERAEDLVPAPAVDGLAIAVEHDPSLNRRLYEEIGGEFHWVDLRGRDEAWWRDHVRDRTTLVARDADGEIAGYAELAPGPGGVVDIAYFGIRQGFRARGIGGRLLSTAVAHAWGMPGTTRVTVNTCSLDGAGALPNYRRRGFMIEQTSRATGCLLS